jgi:CRISPR-associated protein Csm4
MLTYRATLRPRAATLTPWQADTLFGQLCWLVRYEQGEAALEEFLAPYRGGRPTLLFSNGFPVLRSAAGPRALLPRPLAPSHQALAGEKKADRLGAMRQAKESKGVRWVTLEDFNALRRGESVALPRLPAVESARPVLKNLINRLTGGTTALEEQPGGGNLYGLEEIAFVDKSGLDPVGVDLHVYVRAEDESWGERARALLGQLARSGYGAKKSSGYGQFSVESWERFTGFDEPLAGANGFVSLSNWVPARADPVRGYYAALVKYGKLGEEFASSENPFKFPLTMLAAGSAFYDPVPREWYGRLVAGLAPADERVVQYGYAFAVPASLPEEEVAP